MLSLLRKATEPVSWENFLSSYISRVYQYDPSAFTAQLKEFDSLRTSFSSSNQQPTIYLRNSIYEYLWQLLLLENRISFDPKQSLSFLWSDTLSSQTAKQSSLAFEKANVLFSFAAVSSQLAGSLNSLDTAVIKTATFNFQLAATALEQISACFGNAPLLDISETVAKTLSLLMLAQAHECIIFMTHQDPGAKQGVLLRLLADAAEKYRALVSRVKQSGRLHGFIEGQGPGLLEAKAAFYEARSQFVRSQICQSEEAWGEEIGRLRVAVAEIEKFQKNRFLLKSPLYQPEAAFLCEQAPKLLASAEKTNSLVYFHPIPNPLPPLATASLARCVPLADALASESSGWIDRFAGLVSHSQTRSRENLRLRNERIVEEQRLRLLKMANEAAQAFSSFNERSIQKNAAEDLSAPNRLLRLAGEYRKFKEKEGDLAALVDRARLLEHQASTQLAQINALMHEDASEYAAYCVRLGNQPPRQLSIAVKGSHLISLLAAASAQCDQQREKIVAICSSFSSDCEKEIRMLSLPGTQLTESFPTAALRGVERSSQCDVSKLKLLIEEESNLRSCFSEDLCALEASLAAEFSSTGNNADAIDALLCAPAASVHKEKLLVLDSYAAKHSELLRSFLGLFRSFRSVFKNEGGDVREATLAACSNAFIRLKELHSETGALVQSLIEHNQKVSGIGIQLGSLIEQRKVERAEESFRAQGSFSQPQYQPAYNPNSQFPYQPGYGQNGLQSSFPGSYTFRK